MDNFKRKITLDCLKDHPEVKPNLDIGLSGKTFIDHFIGVVERAYEQNPEDLILKKGYESLPEIFPPHFGLGCYTTNITFSIPNYYLLENNIKTKR